MPFKLTLFIVDKDLGAGKNIQINASEASFFISLVVGHLHKNALDCKPKILVSSKDSLWAVFLGLISKVPFLD